MIDKKELKVGDIIESCGQKFKVTKVEPDEKQKNIVKYELVEIVEGGKDE